MTLSGYLRCVSITAAAVMLSACAGGGTAGFTTPADPSAPSGVAAAPGSVALAGAGDRASVGTSSGAVAVQAPPAPALPLSLKAGPDLTAPLINDTGSYVNGPIILGNNTAASGTGVQGIAQGNAGYGVFGEAIGSGYIGVYGKATTPGGYGFYGYSSQGDGMRAYSNSNSYFGGYFSNGSFGGGALYAIANSGTGVQGVSGGGYGVTGTSSATDAGVGGFANGDFAAGLYGQDGSGATNAYGAIGNDGSSSLGGAGVWGESQNGKGVYGTSVNSVGVFGQSAAPSRAAVVSINTNGGYLFAGNNGTQDVFTLDASGDVVMSGNLIVDGLVLSNSFGNCGGPCAVPMIERNGEAQLTGGKGYVPLDASFASQLDPSQHYHVTLTPEDDCNGLYVTQKTKAGFAVRELHHGTSTLTFDYRIVGTPRKTALPRPAPGLVPANLIRTTTVRFAPPAR